MGVAVVNEHPVSSFQPPFICKAFFSGANAEGRFENGLGSVTEMGVKGYPFIMETTHKFSCYMLGIGSTSAIAADQDFMAFCQGPAADVRHIQNHGKKSSAFLQHFFMIVKN